jgi:hypothetical protein
MGGRTGGGREGRLSFQSVLAMDRNVSGLLVLFGKLVRPAGCE